MMMNLSFEEFKFNVYALDADDVDVELPVTFIFTFAIKVLFYTVDPWSIVLLFLWPFVLLAF